MGWYRLTVRGPEEITSSLEQGVELYNDRSSQFDIVKGIFEIYLYLYTVKSITLIKKSNINDSQYSCHAMFNRVK